jgi:hypothetical protein
MVLLFPVEGYIMLHSFLCSKIPFVVANSNGTQEIFNELNFDDFWN